MMEKLRILACLCAVVAGSCVACLTLLCLICAPFAVIGYTIYKCLSLFK